MQPQPWPLLLLNRRQVLSNASTRSSYYGQHTEKQTYVIILFLGLTIVIRKLLLAMEYLKHRVLPHSSSPNF